MAYYLFLHLSLYKVNKLFYFSTYFHLLFKRVYVYEIDFDFIKTYFIYSFGN